MKFCQQTLFEAGVAVFIMNSKTNLRKISYNYFLLLLLTFGLLFPQRFFCLSHPNGMFIARHLRHLFVAGIVKNTLTTVFSISRITFTVVKLSVYKEVRLKVLPQIQSRRQWWQKWNLSISYGGNFWRHFVSSSFARRPRKKCARVSHEMAQSQLVLKIAHLANSMNSTPLLENISSFGVACSAGVFWAGESCLFMFVLL